MLAARLHIALAKCGLEFFAPVLLQSNPFVAGDDAGFVQDRLLMIVIVMQPGWPIEFPPAPWPSAELRKHHHQHGTVPFPRLLRLLFVSKNREVGIHAQPQFLHFGGFNSAEIGHLLPRISMLSVASR